MKGNQILKPNSMPCSSVMECIRSDGEENGKLRPVFLCQMSSVCQRGSDDNWKEEVVVDGWEPDDDVEGDLCVNDGPELTSLPVCLCACVCVCNWKYKLMRCCLSWTNSHWCRRFFGASEGGHEERSAAATTGSSQSRDQEGNKNSEELALLTARWHKRGP